MEDFSKERVVFDLLEVLAALNLADHDEGEQQDDHQVTSVAFHGIHSFLIQAEQHLPMLFPTGRHVTFGLLSTQKLFQRCEF